MTASLPMSYAAFAGFAPVSLLAMVWLCLVAWRRQAVPGARSLGLLAALAAAWIALDLVEMLAPAPRLSLAATQGIHMITPWMGLMWFTFAAELTGRRSWLRSPFAIGIAATALVSTVVAATAHAHDLLWTSVADVVAGPFQGHRVTYGAWFWVHAAVSWATVALGSGLILVEYARSLRTYRRLSVWVAIGATLPVATDMAFVLGVLPGDKSLTILSFVAAAGAFALSIFRYRLFDLRPTARAVLVDRMSEGLLVLDRAGRVTDFNAALGALLDRPVALGDPLTRLLPALASALDADAGEVEVAGPDGPRQLEWRASDVGERGQERGRLVLLHDVTERRAAEDALRKALAEVEARNADLDAFAHTVAHDLKNPIHTILGYTDLLQNEPDLDDAMRAESLDVIARTAAKMGDIVRELLLMASVRQGDAPVAPVDMGAVVDEVLDGLAATVRQREATLDRPAAWPAVLGHGPWLEEVWGNYLSNALKYGGEAPRIRLGAEPAEAGQVRFWVADDGPGLSEADRAEAFTPFTRFAPGAADGHGLGLSVVSRIVEKLGGRVGVESAPGAGARFWFTLPAAPEAVEAQPTEAPA